MARLALSVAGGILGAILIPGVGASLGFAIGSALGGIIGALAFPGKGTHVYGPRINDMQVSSSAPGQVIPLIFGTMRLGGQIIWSTGLIETANNVSQSAKGGPAVTQTSYTYTVSFAAAFAQGPASITRIWGDTKLIYDSGGNSNVNRGTWNADTNYNVNDLVLNPADNTTVFICIVANKGNVLNNSNFWQQDIAAQNINTSKYTPPVLYPGDENQLPSPLIVLHEGAAVTPAYRGTCYAVWDALPLADFGNRLPNIRAEVTSNGTPAYPMNLSQWPFSSGSSYSPDTIVTDHLGETAFAFVGNAFRDTAHAYIQRIDLATNTVVASGLIDMSELAGFIPGTDTVAGYAGRMTVDGKGYLWGIGTVNGQLVVAKIDPWTFKAIYAFNLQTNSVCNAEPFLTSYVAQDGTSYIVGFGTSSFGAGNGNVMFAISVDGVPLKVNPATGLPTYSVLPGGLWGQYYNITAPLAPGDSSVSVVLRQVLPIVDDSGNVYFIFEVTHAPSGNTGDWCIIKIPMFAGNNVFPSPGPVFMGVEQFSYPADSTIGVGDAMFWNPNDLHVACHDNNRRVA